MLVLSSPQRSAARMAGYSLKRTEEGVSQAEGEGRGTLIEQEKTEEDRKWKHHTTVAV